MKSKSTTVANDAGWQKRSDEWVKMSHESRRRKEAEKEQGKAAAQVAKESTRGQTG